MWNLSAIAAKAQEAAAKAQEAAARLEKQLDDSVGVKDGGASDAAINATSTAASSLSVTHEDFDDDDDFFSDNHHETAAPIPTNSWGQAQQIPKEEEEEDAKLGAVGAPATPMATKLNVNADDGDDFFGEEEPSPAPVQQPQQDFEEKRASENGSEEVDFGGDGWDDGEDIPLDDVDYDEDPVQQQQVEDVQLQESMPEPEPVVKEQEQIQVDQPFNASDVPMGGPPEPTNNDVAEEEANGIAQAEYSESSEKIVQANGFEEVTNDNTMQENYGPADSGYDENQVQNIESIPPSNMNSEPQPPATTPAMDDAEKQQFLATIAELESKLFQREEQLASKSDQITSLSLQHESETSQLRQAIAETKEEAKKRVVRAKERVEEMQTKLADAVRRADAAGGSSAEQSEMIAALRAEGENLARKQSTMEQSVRSAKGEARVLQEALDMEKEAREKEEVKVEALEKEVKTLKEELSSARKGESQSIKLEGELVAAKEESEKQRASNMVLEQQLKELKNENKSLKKEVEDARAGAALELEGESNKLRKERDDMLGDLESKLRTSEREANVREDALRHEVSELRKRWQDAVRRAEDLSMDVQHSTAPLLRQLESTERQNRSRAAAWAELETKLRSDLEEHVIQSEKLTKARNDLVASDKRSQRLLKEKEEELASSQEAIEELTATIENLEAKLDELEDEGKKTKQELAVAERRAAEGASKVRNEMLQTVVDSEQRYQSQIEALEEELEAERQRRDNLEKQLDDLAQSVAAAEFAHNSVMGEGSPTKEKKLRSADNQASILHDTLAGFDTDDDDDEGDENGIDKLDGRGSFAAMEQLSLGLKGAKVELEALRKQLTSSEETRESLLEELGDARQAVEKLPLFEQKVSDLTMEVNVKDLEIRALQDDIADVRFLYRTQLDSLLEEKAASTPFVTPSSSMPVSGEEDDEEHQEAVKVDE